MDKHTWIKPRRPYFLKSLFTIKQVFFHIIIYAVYTISPTFTGFLSLSRPKCQRWCHNHQLTPSWLHRPTHIDVFQMLLQFGTGTKTRRQIGANGEWMKTKKIKGVVSLQLLSHFYKDEVFEVPISAFLPLRGNDLPFRCSSLMFKETCSSFPSRARATQRRPGIMSTHSCR